jgi:hypothetical protein
MAQSFQNQHLLLVLNFTSEIVCLKKIDLVYTARSVVYEMLKPLAAKVEVGDYHGSKAGTISTAWIVSPVE